MVAGIPRCLSWHWKAVILNGTWHELLDCCNSSAFHAFSLHILKYSKQFTFNYANSKTVRQELDKFWNVCSAWPPGVSTEIHGLMRSPTALLTWLYTTQPLFSIQQYFQSKEIARERGSWKKADPVHLPPWLLWVSKQMIHGCSDISLKGCRYLAIADIIWQLSSQYWDATNNVTRIYESGS